MTREYVGLMVVGLFMVVSSCTTSVNRGPAVMSNGESIEDMQSAVGSITNAIVIQGARAKYCPVCGKHYSPNVAECPDDGAALKEIDE